MDMHKLIMHDIQKQIENIAIQDRPVIGPQMRITFRNGYVVSVITGYGAYSNRNRPFELAVLVGGELIELPDEQDEVAGYLTGKAGVGLLRKIMRYPPVEFAMIR